ncbi:helix-turn-helix domain-containing protein [Nocardia sp. CC227C]|uniref:helix-turn-helix domain-containing protein n=1 Tax=Nocardia sp. CC227C TaxID=3044562 RepID=UPI00278C7166|nr:helix-turn-helix transcriptional regulator [Nocardia sp. CC227C]
MVLTKTNTATQLADRITERRRALKLSGKDLAGRAGLNPSTVSRIEQGVFAHPTPQCLRAIAEALGIPADELFDLTGGMPRAKNLVRTPRIRVTYHDVSPDIAREVFDAIEAVTKRHRILLNSSHDHVHSRHDRT